MSLLFLKRNYQKANKKHWVSCHPPPHPPMFYSPAAGYIHQELPNVGEYDEACICDTTKKTQKPPEKKDDCSDIKTLLDKSEGGKKGIDHCNPKTEGPYPPWKNDASLVEDTKTWMPPRRIKLCVINLQYLNEKISPEELRKAFIQCAAIETFWLWHKYKEDKKKEQKTGTTTKPDEVVQIQLESGTIPDDFKRQMFYTFGDYRDLCLDTDISSKADTSTGVGKVKINIDSVFQKIDITNVEQRKPWWGKNAEAIWDGMLCALSYNTTNKNMDYNAHTKLNPTYGYNAIKSELEDFVNRPQFLRWFTEWSDEFCTERQKKEEEVKTKCTQNYDGCEKNNKHPNCANACKEYKKYITDKQSEYTDQEQKFKDDKRMNKPEYNGYSEKEASKYLKDKCLDKKCDYMEKVKDTSAYWVKPFENFEKDTLKNKCKCKDPVPPPTKPEVPAVKVQEACTIVEEMLTGKGATDDIQGCKTNPMVNKLISSMEM
ncbi:hypothetical protein PFHG_05488 [Plasmodium falciparum HB3]|uniref:Duffy-antigen binding domain-containing protein n=1 Tax=Plasmodium falciparum (isolate HB3) TaxID=137071 RepID=A0A0L7KLZ1_PLAFX|nr:hypothetical protein PFHG_05488 [Plasmodium falciparum HB3]